MFIKFAKASVLEARVAHRGDTLLRTAHRAEFDYEPREGFIYVRSRAISSRTNDNFDSWPAEELKQAWSTFIGKPVFVNHNNSEIKRKRGVIIDAALHEDKAPDGTPDTWVEVLMEIDAQRFPRLAAAILAGDIERTSMGADVGESECSYCGNVATTPSTYCNHIARCKGQRLSRRNMDGTQEDVLVHEICRKISFFENSVLVEDPADPTAYAWVDNPGVRSIGMTAAVADKQIVYNNEKKRYELLVDGKYMRHSTSLDALKLKFPDVEVVTKTAACNVLVDDMDVLGHITPQRPGILLQRRDGMSLVMFADGDQRMFPSPTVVDVGPFWNGVGTVIATKKLAFGETRAPSQVNTLSQQDCAVCGASNSFDSTGRCTTCSYMPTPDPFRAPDLDVAQNVDMRDGWVNPELMAAPAFVSPDEQGASDPATPNPNPEPGGAVTASVHPVDPSSSPSEWVESSASTSVSHQGAAMRPSQQVTASQEDVVAKLRRENAQLRAALASRTKQADLANPGDPVPEPAAQGAVLADGIDDVPFNGDGSVTTPGAEMTDTTPDATTTVTDQGTALPDVAPDATTDVTAPVAGNTPSGDDYVVKTDPQAGTPAMTPAFDGDNSWVQSSQQAQARTYASIRLARLRIAAGIEKDDDITVAQKIASSKITDDTLRNEIETLSAVAAARPAPQQQRQATRRGIPTLASQHAPMLGEMPSLNPTDDEFLFT